MRKEKKTIPTTCMFSRDGVFIACGCDDGSLQLWEYGRSAYVYPKLQVRAAHAPGNLITSTFMSYCNRLLLSRSLDETMKLWDLRMFKKPVHEVNSLDTFFPMTDCILSPDQRWAVTGTSTKKGEGAGKLLFYDAATNFDLKYEIEFPNSSVVRLLWHPKLNQIFVGLSDGRIMLYYSPIRSQHGALLCVVKGTKRVKEQPFVTESQIIAPFAIKGFKEGERDIGARKLMMLHRRDTQKKNKYHKPQATPLEGQSAGGRLIQPGGTMHSFFVHQMGMQVNMLDEMNPREALLRHAKDAAENPQYTKAWKGKPILADRVVEEEKPEEEFHPMYKKTKLN